MKNESIRFRILGMVVLTISLGFFIFYFIDKDEFQRQIILNKYWSFILIILVFLAFRSFFISRFIVKFYERRGLIPKWMKYANLLFEISTITLILLVFSFREEPYVSLFAPITGLYFVVIILSILEMNFKISVFAGVLSALEFTLFSVYLNYNYQVPESMEFVYTPSYITGRSLMFIMCGAIAGFLANKIKRRVIDYFTEEEEKNKIKRLFGEQLSPHIVDQLIKNPASFVPVRQNACILFLDITDFTKMTSGLSPEKLIAFQNAVFPKLISIIYNNRGIVNQIMGDGFMAVFSEPLTKECSCDDAINAAAEILTEVSQLHFETIQSINVRIGIHYGEVVTGNIGLEHKKQYSITGQAVIIAARLEQLNKQTGTNVLVSEDLVTNLSNRKELTKVGNFEVKGIHEPLAVYTL